MASFLRTLAHDVAGALHIPDAAAAAAAPAAAQTMQSEWSKGEQQIH